MSTPVIEIIDLWFSFNGEPVLKKVDLTVYQREFLAVIGPNGGGKTTLLKLMLGLLEADKGKIMVFGKPPMQVAHSGCRYQQKLPNICSGCRAHGKDAFW